MVSGVAESSVTVQIMNKWNYARLGPYALLIMSATPFAGEQNDVTWSVYFGANELNEFRLFIVCWLPFVKLAWDVLHLVVNAIYIVVYNPIYCVYMLDEHSALFISNLEWPEYGT